MDIYSAPRCGLCDRAKAALTPLVEAAGGHVKVHDISQDAVLEARYRKRIPVVVIDGEEAFEYRVDEARARVLLEAARARSARGGEA